MHIAAAGLLTTSDGKPKFVDFLDCTGGGDIDTSKKEASREEDGGVVLNGLSGRTLKLGEWARGTSEFRVGATRLLALLPSSVRRRIAAERKVSFEVAQHAHVTRVQRDLDALESGESKLTGFAKTAAKKDLELMLTELKAMMDSYDDAGPLLDVVLYKEGGDDGVWRAVVDTGGAGDLTAASPMAPYRHERQVSQLGFGTELTYCVQVYDEGATLCIVTDAGSHGTHVAGIVAANFEDAPERNGVAPGAQILACKIGDGRLDSAETGTGLVRALIAAKAAGCDLINLSYGEPFWQGEGGRVAQTFTDAVRKWNMAVFTSAGNSGPALSTLGAPGCLTAPITVGAYVSPPMMADQYSMLPAEEVEATCYWFTSRGPTPDGYMPTLCAPGGAIAPVPRHALQGKAQYHGTSMASPNACGVAACVLSALRQAGVEVGPIELRRALENSATAVEQLDPFGQGAGLINAPGAVEYAMAHHGKPAQHLDFEVTVPGRNDARGIYLRDQQELDGPLSIGVKVVPLFEHATGAGRSASDLEELLGTDLDIALSSTAEWLDTPPTMVLLSAKERGSQSFVVRVDPSGLAPGVHFARVQASDATDASRGPLFSLPVTVVVPEPPAPPNEPTRFELDLLPGAPARRFLSAPADAEWATVKLTTGAMPKGPHTVLFHAVPSARGDMPHDLIQTFRMLALREHSETTVQVPVRGGATLELCMSLSWLANPSPVEALGFTVDFHSYGARGRAMAAAVSRPLRIGAADSSARLEVSAPLHTEKLNPKAELTAIERTLRPASAVIAAASAELDVLPPSDVEVRAAAPATAEGTQIHQMVLQYKFEVTEKDAISVMPRVQSLHAQLYDSPLDSMLWRLQDANGATLQYGGAIHDATPTKLGKGSYVVDLLLRHPDRAQLSSLKDLPLMLHMALAKPLGCTVYGARDAAASRGHGGAAKVGAGWLRKGGHKDLYVCPPSGEGDGAVPKWAAAGDVMVGELLLDVLEPTVSAMPLVYEVPAHPIEAAKDDDDDDDDDDDAKDGSKDGSKEGAEAKDADAAKDEAADEEKEKEAEAKDEEALSKKLLQASLEQLASLVRVRGRLTLTLTPTLTPIPIPTLTFTRTSTSTLTRRAWTSSRACARAPPLAAVTTSSRSASWPTTPRTCPCSSSSSPTPSRCRRQSPRGAVPPTRSRRRGPPAGSARGR